MSLAEQTISNLEPSEYTADERGWRKALKLQEVAKSRGWRTRFYVPAPNVLVMRMIRNDEEIEAVWENGIVNKDHPPEYTNGDGRHVKFRHVAAVKDYLLTDDSEKPMKDINGTRQLPSDEPRKFLPFDINTATEEEIISAVRGRRLKWHVPFANGMKREGWIAKDAKRISVTTHPNRPVRILNFCDTRGGERSVALDQLIRIT